MSSQCLQDTPKFLSLVDETLDDEVPVLLQHPFLTLLSTTKYLLLRASPELGVGDKMVEKTHFILLETILKKFMFHLKEK